MERFSTLVNAAILAAALIVPAAAAPPPDADPALADWFQSLRDSNGRSCCGMGDGHRLQPAEWRSNEAGYQFSEGGVWWDVPSEKILDHQRNPTGEAVVFHSPGLPSVVYCFVLPELT